MVFGKKTVAIVTTAGSGNLKRQAFLYWNWIAEQFEACVYVPLSDIYIGDKQWKLLPLLAVAIWINGILIKIALLSNLKIVCVHEP